VRKLLLLAAVVALVLTDPAFAQDRTKQFPQNPGSSLTRNERAGLRGDIDRISRDLYRRPPEAGSPRR